MVHYVDSFPGREMTIDGINYRYFGGTSYLGIQTDAAFQEILIGNIRKYGTNYGASRKSNIRFSVFEIAEAYLANMVGSESCVTLSSGYLAGQLACSYFGKSQGKLFYAPNTHSALYQINITPYTTFTALDIALRTHVASSKKNTPVLFLDAIDFSGNNYPHFEGLKSLPLDKVILVVDDSHGFGVVGAQGGGVYRMLSQLQPKELIVCASLSKSLGVQAGAVFGTTERIKEIMATSFFGGASPAAPAYMSTLLEAESIYGEKRKLLQQNLELFLKEVKDVAPFSFMDKHPAFSFSDEKTTSYLKENNVLVTSYSYPNKTAAVMSRIVLSAAHTKEDITYLTRILNSY